MTERSRNCGSDGSVWRDIHVAGLIGGGDTFLATGVDPTAGNWSTFTATFTGTLAEVGDPITIELLTSGAQGNFDNERWSDDLRATVPERPSLLLLGIGLVPLLRSCQVY